MTQAQLGTAAHYKKGAGVTISRIENGQLEPSPERLEDIASALEISPGELKSVAGLSVSRESTLTLVLENFSAARDHASSEFLLRLRELAAHLMDLPQPEFSRLKLQELPTGDDTEAEVAFQMLFNRLGLEHVLASRADSDGTPLAGGGIEDRTFVESVARGVVSVGAPALAAGGAAALRGLHASMRVGASTAPGAGALDIAMNVAAFVGKVIGLATSGTARTRKQAIAAAENSYEVAGSLSVSQPGVIATKELMPKATEVLEYIAVHGGHALSRWATPLEVEDTSWMSLTDSEQRRYREFVQVAAACLAVADIWPHDLMLKRGEDLALERARVEEVLTQSQKIAESYV